MVVRFCFGLLWSEVLEGPRPILKLKLVRDGGSQFGEVMEFSPRGTGFAMTGPLISVSGFFVIQAQSGGKPLIEFF